MHYKYSLENGVTKIRSKLRAIKLMTALSATGVVAAAALPIAASAAGSQVVVTPTNTQGWSTADTRTGGAVNFVADSTAPGSPHTGALQLTTDATTTSKAQYLHDANTPLANVTDLSYSTKQNSASFAEGDASYQIPVELNGSSGFSTLVYEPYQNPTQGTVTPGVWQQWDVDQGLFWSSRTVTCSNGTIVGTAGGPATYTLAQINSICPDAVAVGFGVNVGSNNPGYDVEADLVNFNGTTYNFEPFQTPSDKDACKKDGYKTLTDQNGQPFRNQGQCVSWTNGRGQ
ncbi:MAG TPA: hypothetical protein VFH99_02150 [Candidatus Saccharimonadales bacterium]|nr:hypothetical protein [Candidatus Saccharimonadales bacterium]